MKYGPKLQKKMGVVKVARRSEGKERLGFSSGLC
jgi:hypothetical protein